MEAMIETVRLRKSFGAIHAVDDLSFAVAKGEVLGFLGPNGAGKSTTMKMIAGFLTPTEGRATVCGFDVERDPVKAKAQIGYLPEGAPSYGEMTPASFLDFIARVRGLSGSEKERRSAQTVERLNLGSVIAQPIDTLSKGYKRRVGLAQAILHDPHVLILDEPTDGLDPNQKHEVRSLIREMAADKIIIISTHILEEVHAVCGRAIIIARGRILADDTPAALEARSSRHNAVSLRLSEVPFADAQTRLASLDRVRTVEDTGDGGLRVVPRDGAFILPEVGQLAMKQGWHVDELQVESGRLDEVFREITTQAGLAEVRS